MQTMTSVVGSSNDLVQAMLYQRMLVKSWNDSSTPLYVTLVSDAGGPTATPSLSLLSTTSATSPIRTSLNDTRLNYSQQQLEEQPQQQQQLATASSQQQQQQWPSFLCDGTVYEATGSSIIPSSFGNEYQLLARQHRKRLVLSNEELLYVLARQKREKLNKYIYEQILDFARSYK